jgi:hypothetical protein
VLEVGFGTVLNLPHYPAGVKRLIALDRVEMLPTKVSWRIAAASIPAERGRQIGEQLPFADRQFDCGDNIDALHHRGSRIRVVRNEAGSPTGGDVRVPGAWRSTEPKVSRVQDRLNPLWLRSGIGCGCNINRPIDLLLAQAGFCVEILDRYVRGGLES